MRRITMLSVLGLLAAGLGCRHVGGKCDCGAHPGDAVIAGPTAPYPTTPAPGVTPVAPAVIPPAGTTPGNGGVRVPAPDRIPSPMPR